MTSVVSGSSASNYLNIGTKSSNVIATLDPRREAAIMRLYPAFALGRYKHLVKQEQRMEHQSEALFQQAQGIRLEVSKLNTNLRSNTSRLASASKEQRVLLEAENAEIAEQIADKREALEEIEAEKKTLTSPANVEDVRLYMLRMGGKHNDGTRLSEYKSNLPAQSPEKDVKALADIRSKIDGCAARLRELDLAPLPEEMALEKALAQIDKIAKGSAPDFSPTTRLAKRGADDKRTQGEIKWPTRFVKLDQFEPDAFRLLFWLFGDEIKTRAHAEIKKLMKPGALTVAERAEKKLAIEIERFELWRIEEALVTRLREAGRVDINYRREMPIPVLLRLI